MHQQQLIDDLYSNLLSAVQEIQEQVAHGIDVFWNCGAVDRLCYSMDDILSHGLKEGLLSWAASSEVSFWPLAVKITCKKGIEDIIRLNLKNDQEKCVSWIRQGLKENTLGSYINVITQDEKLIREFYHSYAFISDGEKAERVKNLLTYGISHLDFDISLSSSTRRPISVEAKPVLASDAMIHHLPFRSSLVNGYSSPINNPDENGIFPATPNGDMASAMTENTGKKRKKKRKVGVAMIAESIDAEESKYINVIQTKKDFDLHASKGSEPPTQEFQNGMHLVPSEDKIEGENNQTFECSKAQSISQSEEDSSSGISLTMEHPAIETMLLMVNEEMRDDCDARHVDGNKMKNGPPVTNHKHFKETDQGINSPEADQTGKDINSCEADQPIDVKTDLYLEPGVLGPVESNILHRVEDEVSTVVSGPSLEASQPSFENSPSKVELNSRKCSAEGTRDDSGSTQHRVSLATFECGTPKQIDDISQIEKDRGMSCTSYEDEDFNIVPGIHKNDGKLSRSGSSGSFSASGSYQVPLRKNSRNSTMDSTNRSSTSRRSAASDSWKYTDTSFTGSSRKNSRADLGTGSPSSESHFSEYELFDELLGLQEDHFSPPESFMGVSTSEELMHAIQSCKDLISTSTDDSQERQTLINKLVQLRLRLQETQDSKTEDYSDVQKVLGHIFRKEEEPGNKTICDKCGKTIWIWQSLFTCKACKYNSHRRCLDMIRRPCASRKVSFSTYNLVICPETGLSSQQYKCAECRKQIALTKGERSEGRLCDYTGQYFCEECHWNDLIIIPARVVHNWDFTTYKVSRQAKQLLALMLSRPLLNIERLNPALFKFVVELREIKRLREEILIMKKYFMACRKALESKLLLQLKDRQHFVDTADIYSLQDLIEVNSGSLLPFLTKIHSLFLTHIKSDCQLCQAKGFVCELCQSNEVIFAFDPHVAQCTDCRSVYHKMCFKVGICPKCERRQKRAQTSQ